MHRRNRPTLNSARHKLLASPLRLRILHALLDTEKTAAQVADALGESRSEVVTVDASALK